MRKLNVLLACVMLCSASPVLADFVNGGFETGDFTGWTLVGGARSGSDMSITWGAASGHSPQYGIWTNSSDSTSPWNEYQTLHVAPYNGTYMARIGDPEGNNDATMISQAGGLTAADITSGHVYVNWGAILEEPGHPAGNEPYFGITVLRNGSQVYSFEADASAHASDPTWLSAGTYSDGSPLFYKSDTWSGDISGWSVGDTLNVEMFISDCGWGGHGSWAFLDGISTTNYEPPNTTVTPLPAAVILGGLGLSFAGWLTHRRGELLG